MAFLRTVKTASGATAVQIVYSHRGGCREIEHIGSANDEAELEALKAASRQRLAAGQQVLGLDLATAGLSGALPITSSRMGHLWDGLGRAYDVLGFADAAVGDEVFRQLVLARIVEPTSKLDSARVLEGIGIDPPAYRTLTRRLRVYATDASRLAIGQAAYDAGRERAVMQASNQRVFQRPAHLDEDLANRFQRRSTFEAPLFDIDRVNLFPQPPSAVRRRGRARRHSRERRRHCLGAT